MQARRDGIAGKAHGAELLSKLLLIDWLNILIVVIADKVQ